MTGPAMGPRTGRVAILDDGCGTGARVALGRLLRLSTSADFAVSRLRLAAIDFHEDDLVDLEQCRVILGHLDVHSLIDAAEAASRVPAAAANVAVLRRFIGSGRLNLRSGGASRWRPDFCLMRGDGLRTRTGAREVALVGHLGIGSGAARGPNLTCVVAGTDAVRRASGAFDRLWTHGHDVLDVVAETLDRYAAG